MSPLLRTLYRRRLRSLLTIIGVATGVFALVVLGAMVEKLQTNMSGLSDFYAGKIMVIDEQDVNSLGFANGNRPLTAQKLEEVRAIPGVLDVAPMVAVTLDIETLPIYIPPAIMSLGGTDKVPAPYAASEGRLFTEDETGVAVIGVDLARRLDAAVGDTITTHDREFEIVGVIDRTYVTTQDQDMYVPVSDARAMLIDTLPKTLTDEIDPEDLNIQFVAYPEPGVDADELAPRIAREIDGVVALGPEDLMAASTELNSLFELILMSVGALALLIGGLTVINTMTMSVAEQTRELGTKRALGASANRIAREVLAEAAMIGVIGGLLGLALGTVTAVFVDRALLAESGISLLRVTWRLEGGALLVAVVLATLAGVYPALHAARLDPVDALAHE